MRIGRGAAARVADARSLGLHERSPLFHQMSNRHAWRRFYHDIYQRVGDELQFSPGFFTDLWHYLTSDVSMRSLVVGYLLFEVSFIFIFGAEGNVRTHLPISQIISEDSLT